MRVIILVYLQDFHNKNVSIFDDLYLDASWALGSLYYSKLSLLLWGVIQYLLSSIWFLFDFLTWLSLSFSLISSHIGFLIQISLFWIFFFFLKKLMRLVVLHFLISLWLSSFLFFCFLFFFLILCVSLFFFVLRNAFSMGLYLELPTVSLPYFMDIKVRINPSRYFGN